MTATLGEAHPWFRWILLAMAAAGIGGGFLAARIFSEPRGRSLVIAGLTLAGLAAGLTWVAAAPAAFLAAAILTGSGTGIVTVTLPGCCGGKSVVHAWVSCLGLATGAAYALCNLPPVFSGALKRSCSWRLPRRASASWRCRVSPNARPASP
ncbi:MAG: hypothetical protein WDM96_13625 [Lacunisphaera sp.]